MIYPVVKQFIKDNADLIRHYQFEELYRKAQQETFKMNYEYYGQLSEMLIAAGLDPLDHMKYLPPLAFAQLSEEFETIRIPGNIKKVSLFALDTCGAKTIIIDEGCEELLSYCMSGCPNLKRVILPQSLTEIEKGIFESCPNLYDIEYNGTVAEFEYLKKDSNWAAHSNVRKVICSDNTLDLYV